MAAAAMRIAVGDVLLAEQGAARLQYLYDDRVSVPDLFPDDLFRKAASRTFGVKKATSRVHGTVDRKSVLDAYLKVLLTVAGSGVDSARALLERDVLAENSD